MKNIFTLISAIALSISVNAQAPLPTQEKFETFSSTTMQAGWSTNIEGTFTYLILKQYLLALLHK